MKKIIHYKSLDNLFIRNGWKKIHSPYHRDIALNGFTWYNSTYFTETERKHKATLFMVDGQWFISLNWR